MLDKEQTVVNKEEKHLTQVIHFLLKENQLIKKELWIKDYG